MVNATGGQTRVGKEGEERLVLVTPKGEEVGTAARPRPTFTSGGGARPPSEPTVTVSRAAETIKPVQTIDPRIARRETLLQQQQENVRLGRSEGFGLSNADLIFLRGATARDLRREATKRGIDIGTSVKELSFINLISKEAKEEIDRRKKPDEKEKLSPKELKKRSRISQFLVPGIQVGVSVGIPGTPAFKELGRTVKFQEITQSLFDQLEKKGFSKEKIAGFTTLSDENIDKLPKLDQKQKDTLKRISNVQENIIIGGLQEIEEDPEKIIAVVGLSSLAPEALTGLAGTKIGLKILNKVPTSIKKKGGAAVSKFLTGLYLTTTGLQIATEPTAELRAKKVGRIIAGEVAPFTIGTKLGVKGLLRKEVKAELENEVSKLSKDKRAAFEDYFKQAEAFGRFEPKSSNIKLNNIESIPDPKAQKAIRDFLKKSNKNVIVGGSVAQTGQIKVGRKLGDMDLYLETGNPSSTAKQLANALKKAGVERVSSIRGQVTIGGKKSIEFHDIDRLLTNINQVIPSWQNPRNYIIKTPEGILIQRIGLQARRKLVAAFADPARLASGKYRKDLQDFKQIADKIFKNAELKARGAFFFRESKIKRVETVFGKKVSRKPIPETIEKIKKIDKLKVEEPIKVQGAGDKGVKISKKINDKLDFKESNIMKRAKIKLKQKPFSKPSQLPSQKVRPSQPRLIRRSKLSQPPVKRTGLRSQPPTKPFERRVFPPSQPTTKPTKKIPTPFDPPSQPPVKLGTKPFTPFFKPTKKKRALLEIKRPFVSRTTKKKPLKRKPTGEERNIGYNVFGKPIKKKKFIRLNLVPISKTKAKDLGSFLADKSLARTFKFKRTDKPAQKPKLIVPPRYFAKVQRKFRDFRIVKGQQVPLKNTFIEKRGKFLLDTVSERKKITLLRKLSQLKKKSLKPKAKRRKRGKK